MGLGLVGLGLVGLVMGTVRTHLMVCVCVYWDGGGVHEELQRLPMSNMLTGADGGGGGLVHRIVDVVSSHAVALKATRNHAGALEVEELERLVKLYTSPANSTSDVAQYSLQHNVSFVFLARRRSCYRLSH